MEPAAKQTVKLVTCPACSHQVSPHAKSCPSCGHPLSASASSTEADAQIKHVGAFVTLALTTLTLGAQTTFLTFVGSGDAGDAGSKTMLSVFLQTAPLTIAVASIATAHMRKWFSDASQLLFMSAVTLLASVLFGSLVGNLGSLPSFAGTNLVTFPIKALALYWRVYGPSLFLSALILGVFLAWALTKRWPARRAA